MDTANNDVQRLTERIDALVQVNERLLRAINHSLPISPVAANPVFHGQISVPSSPSLPPTVPTELRTRRNTPASLLDSKTVFTGDDSSESDDDESFFVQQPLQHERFGYADVNDHVRDHPWESEGVRLLGESLLNEQGLEKALLVPYEVDKDRQHATYNHINVYTVASDGSALLYHSDHNDVSQACWQNLSSVNGDPTKERESVGRITIVRESAPLLSAAVHLTMNKHFDMDSIFRLLINSKQTEAYMKGCLNPDPRQQRSFVFSFKYHCIVGTKCRPKDWQLADDDLKDDEGHIPLTTCSSVVALSLSGNPTSTLRRRSRKAKSIMGQIYDPFAPWRVLQMQFFPDWESTVDVHEQNRHYVNGPEAFLLTILAEYKDAEKRLRDINDRIVQLVTPGPTFMFDGGLRDKLLFEDKRYTYSRRYFWAFQTLATMNDSIEAMIDAYKETFTEDVWNGEHKFIWPGTRDVSSRYNNWRKKMGGLRKQFESTIKDLQDVLALNIKEQKDIKSLRDQLFSGTSVRESREAIKQNDNIKLLTLVTIFFLPLTFVTSVFGMTNMPTNENFVRFGVVTASICLPSYLLIFSLSSDKWLDRYDRILQKLRALFAHMSGLVSRKAGEKKKSKDYMSSLEPRPALRERRQSTKMSTQDMKVHLHHSVPRTSHEGQRRLSTPERENTVHFEVPNFGREGEEKRVDTNLSESTSKLESAGPKSPSRSFFRSLSWKQRKNKGDVSTLPV